MDAYGTNIEFWTVINDEHRSIPSRATKIFANAQRELITNAMTIQLLIENGYHARRDGVIDIAIDSDGTISEIGESLDSEGTRVIDANGKLVGPGIVDAHIHMDQAFSAEGERIPKYNEFGIDRDDITTRALEYYEQHSWDHIEEEAVRLGKRAAANGTLYMRTHVNIMSEIGLDCLEAMLRAKDRLEGVIELQFVLLTTNGILLDDDAEDLVRDGLEMGGDLVGGTDPASMNNNVEGTLDTWLDIATTYDVEIDAHIHDPSTLGMYVLGRMAEKTIEYDHQGKVTASHAYGLAGTAGKTRGDTS